MDSSKGLVLFWDKLSSESSRSENALETLSCSAIVKSAKEHVLLAFCHEGCLINEYRLKINVYNYS
jgi:hypothetical protein